MSTAWCASLLIDHGLEIAKFPEEAQQAVWGSGADVNIASSLAPSGKVEVVEDGFRLTGEFSFASGVNHSTWAIVGSLVHRPEQSHEFRQFLIPARDFKVKDTWFNIGLRATGSNTIVVDGAFVPASFTIAMGDLLEGTTPGAALHGGIYQLPLAAYNGLTFLGPMLGAARGAYNDYGEWIRGRVTIVGMSVADYPAVQLGVAKAAANLDAAELLLRRAIEQARSSERLTYEQRARSVRDWSHSSDLITAAMDQLLELTGSRGMFESNPIQRAWRDLHAARTHVALNYQNNGTHFGRLSFGLARDPHTLIY